MKNNIKTHLIIILTSVAIIVFSIVFWHAFFYAPADEIILPTSVKTSLIEENKIVFNKGEIEETEVIKEPQKVQETNSIKEIFPNSYPKLLRIPSISVDSKVQYVGITRKGNMSTPNNFKDVGWFKYGTVPGEKGSAIIAGHVDNGLALPAVFNHLDKLIKGDDVYIETISGETIHFKVTNIETFDFNAPTTEIFNQNDGSYLKLITCTGDWNKEFKTHNKRLVITAKLVK